MSDSLSNVSPSASAAAIIARIARIGVSDYRAFPSGPAYEVNLGDDGRNLLLFGENGSGKTSLFRALRDLMATKPPQPAVPMNFDGTMAILTREKQEDNPTYSSPNAVVSWIIVRC